MGRPKRAAAAKASGGAGGKAEENKKTKGGLAVGDALPDFSLQTDAEETVDSQSLVRTIPMPRQGTERFFLYA